MASSSLFYYLPDYYFRRRVAIITPHSPFGKPNNRSVIAGEKKSGTIQPILTAIDAKNIQPFAKGLSRTEFFLI